MPVVETSRLGGGNWVALPVAARELAVAARGRWASRLRVFAALAAVVVGAGFLILQSAMGVAPRGMGEALFQVLTAVCFAAALLSGPLLTADAISEEKRQGTLGLLFLTDLRGYDVVAGKLAATSMRMFYAILSVFPVLGIALLMGGVSGGRLWRTSLALALASLCSLMVGLLVSSLTQSSARALGRTLAFMVVWLAIPLMLGAAAREFPGWHSGWLDSLSLLFLFTSASNGSFYGVSLAANAALCAGAFWLACYFTPRRWQESEKRGGPAPAAMRCFHREWMDPNPMVWLSCRNMRRTQRIVMVCSALLLALVVGMVLFNSMGFMVAWGALFGLFTFFLYLWTASGFSRLFVGLRQNGFIELLLVTPLSVKDIVAGQWIGWIRMFAFPLALVLAAHLFATAIATYSQSQAFAGQQSAISSATAIASSAIAGSLSTLLVVANLAALACFGAYAGITSKSPGVALLKTFGFVQILPWFVISFVSGIMTAAILMPLMLRSSAVAPSWMLLMSSVPSALGIIKDAVFIVWSRKRLLGGLRELAVRPLGGAAIHTAVWRAQRASPGALPPVIPDTK